MIEDSLVPVEPNLPSNTQLAPWDRQPGEIPSAWDAFRRYRDMPTSQRNLKALHRKLVKEDEQAEARGEFGASPPAYAQLSSWASQYNWTERALAWDVELDKVWQEETFSAHRIAARRHWEAGLDMQEKGRQTLEHIDPEALAVEHPEEARKLIESGIDTERKALGMDKEEPAQDISSAVVIIQVVERLERQMLEQGLKEIEGEFKEVE